VAITFYTDGYKLEENDLVKRAYFLRSFSKSYKLPSESVFSAEAILEAIAYIREQGLTEATIFTDPRSVLEVIFTVQNKNDKSILSISSQE